MPASKFSAEKRSVFVLTGAQALFQTAAVLMFTLAALVGQMLADDKRLATLPVALSVAAAAALLIPAAFFMRRFGRKAGFLVGILCGGLSGLLGAWAIDRQDFWMFAGATVLMGGYQSFAQYYRFAAAEAAGDAFRSRAISWVIAGGVFAAIAGPALARFTSPLGVTPFMYSYLTLAALSVIAAALVLRLRLPTTGVASHASAPPRPLLEIVRQPVFITALTLSTVGFGLMAMIMTATPLAMQFCGQPLGAAASVIQWHVLGMFVPSFFTGKLIHRFGVLPVAATGILLFALQVAIALAGIEFMHFVASLILLGVGWNFLFIGGTTMLVQAYRPGEQTQAQAAHDFLMFSGASLASFSAGSLLNTWGWHAVNLSALPCLALAALTIVWHARQPQTVHA